MSEQSRQTRTIERAIRDGLVTISPEPVPHWYGERRLWDVVITDAKTGEQTTKTFRSQTGALEWLGSVWEHAHPRPVGRPRKAKTGNPVLDDEDDEPEPGYDPEHPSRAWVTATADRELPRSGQTVDATGRGGATFKLKSVRDALAAAGFDPTTAIAEALAARKPVIRKRAAKQADPQAPDFLPSVLMDDDTDEVVMVPVLDEETRVRTALSLLEFVEPKLKSVEHFVEEKSQSLDEVDSRIRALVAKRQKQAADEGAGDAAAA